ncbi:hypothetical protein TcWFU_007816 [Taenia crassiceps]|uniref:Calcium channel flower n=1 Tax=Taenia crassiceps TaxID=6207 RepID=A0ABR4QF12_9CEST
MLSEPASRGNTFIRYGTQALHIITGILCCILGIVGAIGFLVICVFAGVFLFFIGLFILVIEMPFCCSFIPQTEFITRAVDKVGQLPIAIVCIIVGIIAMAMCPSISMGFALLFLLASAAVRIREFILVRRARSQGGVGLRAESGLHNAPRTAYSGVEDAFPPAVPAYGVDSMMDRVAAGAAMGATQAAMQGPGY